MIKDKVQFLHFRHVFAGKVNPKGGLTIAYKLHYEGEIANSIEFEFSECSLKDHYNKRKGRLISGGRLRSSKVESEVFSIDSPETWFDDFEYHINQEYAKVSGYYLGNTSRARSI